MAPIKRIELALRALTALSLAIAAGALLWPASAPEIEIAPAGLGGGAIASPDAGRHAAPQEAIARSNIFSATRSAPRVRYRPPGSAAEPQGVAEDAAGAAGAGRVPRLYGILPDASGAAALMGLDPAAPGAQLYRDGDHGGRYRVERIGDQSVILSGPSGRVELRLPRPEGAIR
jgi:hypothetical protein